MEDTSVLIDRNGRGVGERRTDISFFIGIQAPSFVEVSSPFSVCLVLGVGSTVVQYLHWDSVMCPFLLWLVVLPSDNVLVHRERESFTQLANTYVYYVIGGFAPNFQKSVRRFFSFRGWMNAWK